MSVLNHLFVNITSRLILLNFDEATHLSSVSRRIERRRKYARTKLTYSMRSIGAFGRAKLSSRHLFSHRDSTREASKIHEENNIRAFSRAYHEFRHEYRPHAAAVARLPG